MVIIISGIFVLSLISCFSIIILICERLLLLHGLVLGQSCGLRSFEIVGLPLTIGGHDLNLSLVADHDSVLFSSVHNIEEGLSVLISIKAILRNYLLNVLQLVEVELALCLQGLVVLLHHSQLLFQLSDLGAIASIASHHLLCHISHGWSSSLSSGAWAIVCPWSRGSNHCVSATILLHRVNFIASSNIIHLSSGALWSPSNRVIWLSIPMDVVILLEPLAELEVILILGLDKLININDLLDAILLEGCIQDLIIFHPLIVEFCIPFHFLHIESAWVNLVDNLAIDGCGGALLNFRKLKL